MRSTYRVLAYLIVLGVVIQAANIAFAWFSVLGEVDSGAVLDENFEGNAGHVLHGMVGMMAIPLIALVLLAVSFFAKVPGGVKWAAIVLGVAVIQVLLAFVAFGAPIVGALHGINALALAVVASRAAQRASLSDTVPSQRSRTHARPDAVELTGATAVSRTALLRRRRPLLASVATLLLVGPLGWMWASSLVPSTYSVMEMGYADLGGREGSREHAAAEGLAHAGHVAAAGPSSQVRDVSTLTGPETGAPDVAVTLVARAEPIRLDGGTSLAGYTLNGTSPGPGVRAEQGDLVEVRLVNESVPDGVTLHWHGIDVPNAEDGVAGVTQDAVVVGDDHVYRFVVEDAGTYWYHSHQVSHEQVRRGLFGAFVVEPSGGSDPGVRDVVATVHTYEGQRTIGGRVGETRLEAEPGELLRVRVVNTDDGGMRSWVTGTPFRVLAVDGRELNEPEAVEDAHVLVTAGGRADLEVRVPSDGSALRVGVGGGRTSLVVGPAGADAPGSAVPEPELDLLSYGEPEPLGLEVDAPDRRFEYRIGRRPGFLDGRPGLWWTVNGRMFPDVPMYVVSEGDVVRMTIENTSGQVHPMHLHGHHALVLSRDGIAATGSPWWVDSLDVGDDETYEIAFLADNPGIWMDHCHNLPHAAEGLVAHLAYDDVTTSYVVGGAAGNSPE